MNIEELLNEEIQAEIETLKAVEMGSESYKIAVDGITKLIDRSIDIQKQAAEREYKEREAEETKKDRLINDGIAIAGIVLPIIVTIWGTKASFKFEEEGTITTIMGRGFINKLLPKK